MLLLPLLYFHFHFHVFVSVFEQMNFLISLFNSSCRVYDLISAQSRARERSCDRNLRMKIYCKKMNIKSQPVIWIKVLCWGQQSEWTERLVHSPGDFSKERRCEKRSQGSPQSWQDHKHDDDDAEVIIRPLVRGQTSFQLVPPSDDVTWEKSSSHWNDWTTTTDSLRDELPRAFSRTSDKTPPLFFFFIVDVCLTFVYTEELSWALYSALAPPWEPGGGWSSPVTGDCQSTRLLRLSLLLLLWMWTEPWTAAL